MREIDSGLSRSAPAKGDVGQTRREKQRHLRPGLLIFRHLNRSTTWCISGSGPCHYLPLLRREITSTDALTAGKGESVKGDKSTI